MGYSAVKGGLDAISAAELLVQHPLLASDETTLDTRQLEHQLGQAIDKIMSEGGLYSPALAALALKQAEGDLFEAAFLLRAYRSTLPRVGYSLPVRGDQMRVLRRISSAFKDVPGGQLLGRTRDYTQRLLDFSLLGGGAPKNGKNGVALTLRPPLPSGEFTGLPTFGPVGEGEPNGSAPLSAPERGPGGRGDEGAPWWDAEVDFPKVADTMRAAGLIAPLPDRSDAPDPPDITIDAMRFPVPRAARLQALARGERGAMLSFAYSSQRELGMPIMVGAPNIVRGGSQSGNLDARELIRLGLADIICADYHVPSLLPAAFRLVDEGLMDLPAAIRMLTVNAARAVGLRDRGAIEPGLQADLLLVRMSRSGVPSVEQVFRVGRPVFSFAEPSRTPALAIT